MEVANDLTFVITEIPKFLLVLLWGRLIFAVCKSVLPGEPTSLNALPARTTAKFSIEKLFSSSTLQLFFSFIAACVWYRVWQDSSQILGLKYFTNDALREGTMKSMLGSTVLLTGATIGAISGWSIFHIVRTFKFGFNFLSFITLLVIALIVGALIFDNTYANDVEYNIEVFRISEVSPTVLMITGRVKGFRDTRMNVVTLEWSEAKLRWHFWTGFKQVPDKYSFENYRKCIAQLTSNPADLWIGLPDNGVDFYSQTIHSIALEWRDAVPGAHAQCFVFQSE
jgi:hypothetical protein